MHNHRLHNAASGPTHPAAASAPDSKHLQTALKAFEHEGGAGRIPDVQRLQLANRLWHKHYEDVFRLLQAAPMSEDMARRCYGYIKVSMWV